MWTEGEIRSTSTHTPTACGQSAGIYVLIFINVDKFWAFSAILDKENSKIFRGSMPPHPLGNTCTKAACAFGARLARMVKIPWFLISKCWQVWNRSLLNWRARCKNGLCDDFGPPFTKPPNYLLSCNVTVAKWIVSCNQHIVLVIWIEFPPKLYQVTLPLAGKEKLPKYQEIPIISAGGKKQFCCCPWWMWL